MIPESTRTLWLSIPKDFWVQRWNRTLITFVSGLEEGMWEILSVCSFYWYVSRRTCPGAILSLSCAITDVDDISQGQILADSSIFIACAMTLSVFNITKYATKDGIVIEPVIGQTTGIIRWDTIWQKCILHNLILSQPSWAFQMLHFTSLTEGTGSHKLWPWIVEPHPWELLVFFSVRDDIWFIYHADSY